MADICKVDVDQRIVGGWAYVSHDADGRQIEDYSGDVVDDPTELEKAASNFVLSSRQGDRHHDGRVIAQLVGSIFIDKAKAEAMGIEAPVPTGWWVEFKVTDDEVWNEVRKGNLAAFSIGGTGIRTPIEDDDDD